MTGPDHQALIVSGPGEIALRPHGPVIVPPGELLVEPDLVGLCGTDLEIIDGAIDPAYVRYPVALGHEWTGTVASDGPLAGRRVVVEGIVGCGHCGPCTRGQANLCETYDEIGFTRDGAAAGQICVPARLAHVIGADVAAQDAVLTEPSAVVYRALTRAGVTPGSRVLVIGDGTVALLAVMLLRLWSPAEIAMLGQRPAQAELARAAGASSFSVDGQPAGYDLAIEAAGATAAVRTALGAVRRGGTVLLVGLPPHGQTVPLAADDIVNNDLAILGSFSYTQAAWRSAVGLLNAGLLRPGLLVTHRYPLAGWEQAVAALRRAPGPRGKVLLEIRPPERSAR
ncbi:MAG TPA: alcohol dehydrogenase catalytic domain-containing protein [Streptosporangiaceae bacterium]